MSDRTTMDVDTIICLLRFCLSNTAFQYDNKHYRQEGVAMGSAVSPAVADILTLLDCGRDLSMTFYQLSDVERERKYLSS